MYTLIGSLTYWLSMWLDGYYIIPQMNTEIDLLAECMSSHGETERDGVKYMYMDDNTVYRFENNRMKKVSAAMLKRANKLLTSGDNKPNKRSKKQQQPQQPIEQTEEEELDEPQPAVKKSTKRQVESDDELYQPPPKPRAKPTRIKAPVPDTPVDIAEYYNTKARMEYMSNELERYKNKVTRLKQYKSIVNKLTGGEYDQPYQELPSEPPKTVKQTRQQQPNEPAYGYGPNDSLFMF